MVGNQKIVYVCNRFLNEGWCGWKGCRLILWLAEKSGKKQRKDLDGIAKSTYLCSPQKTENKQFLTRLQKQTGLGFWSLVKRVKIRKIILAGMKKALSFALPIEKRFTKTAVLTVEK